MTLGACSVPQVQSVLCNATEADMITCSEIVRLSKPQNVPSRLYHAHSN